MKYLSTLLHKEAFYEKEMNRIADFFDGMEFEEGYEIKNKLGYLKNAVNSNLDKLNNVSTD